MGVRSESQSAGDEHIHSNGRANEDEIEPQENASDTVWIECPTSEVSPLAIEDSSNDPGITYYTCIRCLEHGRELTAHHGSGKAVAGTIVLSIDAQ